MARTETEVITVRVTEDFRDLILRNAAQGGYVGVDGNPNISAAVKMLLSLAIDDGDGQAIAAEAYRAARSDLLIRFRELVNDHYSEIAEEIG